jgi:hypothetical protein
MVELEQKKVLEDYYKMTGHAKTLEEDRLRAEDPKVLAKADINSDLQSAYQRNRTVMIGSRNGT